MTHSTSKSPRVGRLLAAAIALAGSAAWADEAPSAPAASEPAPVAVDAAAAPDATEAAALEGSVIVRDANGKLRAPTREEALELLSRKGPSRGNGPMRRAARTESRPHGVRVAFAGNESLNYSVATISESGVLQNVCTDDPIAVIQLLDGAATLEEK